MSSPNPESKTKDATDSATNEPAASDVNILQDETDSNSHDSNAKKPSSPQESQGSDVTKPATAESNDNDDDLVVHSTSVSTADDATPYVTNTTTASSPPATATAVTTTTTASSPPTTTSRAVSPPTPAPAPAPAVIPTANAEREARLAILTEAFPTVDREVCEFVLESHRGNVEASINALLEISDPDFQAEPQQPQQPQQQQPLQTFVSGAPPALPRRQPDGQVDSVTQGVGNLDLGQQREIDPILLASTSTSEQQLRSDEELARSIAMMEENQARGRYQQQQQQQQQQEGPSFTTEIKELMEEELPKIKERFNVAADTTKRKVSEWYNQFKANREAAAQKQRQTEQNRDLRTEEIWSSEHPDNGQTPIRFGSRSDDGDEPLARHRVTPPLDGQSPPLPARTTSPRSESREAPPAENRTRLEEELEVAMNTK